MLPEHPSQRAALGFTVVCVLATAWSALSPHDYATWFFELIFGFAGVAALLLLLRRFPFSPFVFAIAAVHFVVLAAGAKYTYAEMPLFDWLKEALDFERNHFDRVGHFFQGLTPALLTREILVRTTGLGRGFWERFLPVSVALAFSAFYELIEWWWVLGFYPDKGPDWLGHQGDLWDAQADMMMAMLGGLLSVIVLRPLHERSIAKLDAHRPATSREG